MSINDKIENRKLFTGFCEYTYYRPDLYDFVVDNWTDPDILFKVKILGRYKRLYRWTDEECLKFITDNLEESRGHEVNGEWYAYDWGSGENKVATGHKMHLPELDHIDPKAHGIDNSPSNFRIRVKRLNENKGDTNTDQERIATIIDMWDDIEDKDSVREYLTDLLKLS